ncbi:MarR family winged helix-turn-helix transcriptional regulator [Streptomyces sp. MS1.AVA.1]|uniref:MarR family winged helix-turn-helix transcriptional regulator n=1 Tax=Streptomyces machairae TaxID=3134109 RepID=A0ABU8UFR0_9ACTN
MSLWFSAVEETSPRLPPRHIRALRAVRRRPALNVTALAEHLRVGLPTASRLCDRLENAGLLRRCVDPGDRREVHLEVTAQGRTFLGTSPSGCRCGWPPPSTGFLRTARAARTGAARLPRGRIPRRPETAPEPGADAGPEH